MNRSLPRPRTCRLPHLSLALLGWALGTGRAYADVAPPPDNVLEDTTSFLSTPLGGVVVIVAIAGIALLLLRRTAIQPSTE